MISVLLIYFRKFSKFVLSFSSCINIKRKESKLFSIAKSIGLDIKIIISEINEPRRETLKHFNSPLINFSRNCSELRTWKRGEASVSIRRGHRGPWPLIGSSGPAPASDWLSLWTSSGLISGRGSHADMCRYVASETGLLDVSVWLGSGESPHCI